MHGTIAARPTSVDPQRRLWVRRMTSASIALGIGVATADALTLVTDLPVGLVGVPIAGVLGWGLATRLDGRASSRIAPVLLMAFGCVFLGAYGVALAATTDILAVLAWGTVGIVFLGGPAFVLLLVPATLWALVTSWFARRPTESGE